MDLFNQLSENQISAIRANLSNEIESWCDLLSTNILVDLHRTLELIRVLRADAIIYPQPDDVLRLFRMLKIEDVKVVILGQDPYFTPDLANGLAFGCATGFSPSLKVIVHTMMRDTVTSKLSENTHPNLEYLVKQGVFLLNSILTVEKDKPLSHVDVGWQKFTNAIISLISNKTNAIFLLWGNEAQTKGGLLKPTSIVMTAAHPAYAAREKTKWDCNHFSKVNIELSKRNQKEIQWI
jgi:uracil-DNA glycosylase